MYQQFVHELSSLKALPFRFSQSNTNSIFFSQRFTILLNMLSIEFTEFSPMTFHLYSSSDELLSFSLDNFGFHMHITLHFLIEHNMLLFCCLNFIHGYLDSDSSLFNNFEFILAVVALRTVYFSKPQSHMCSPSISFQYCPMLQYFKFEYLRIACLSLIPMMVVNFHHNLQISQRNDCKSMLFP